MTYRSLVGAVLTCSLAWAHAPELHAERTKNAWFAAGRADVRAAATHAEPGRSKNVILFLADGMGLSTIAAARILEGQRRGERGEENLLAFERLPYLALTKTYNTDQQVGDSAGTMTAIMSGVKTRAGVIGVDERVRRGDFAGVGEARVPTLLEEAEQRGLATGIVSTARLTHATPAACYAHSADRAWEIDARLPQAARDAGVPDIARQLVEFQYGDGPDVLLGGGRAMFLPRELTDPEHPGRTGLRGDGRNLVGEWRQRHTGAAYVWNLEQLRAVDPARSTQVLGLFEPSHMRWESERPADAAGEPSLAEMTQFALDWLSRDPDGFFLLVEAGRVDHAHHSGNAYRALTDTIELSRAVQVAMNSDLARTSLILVTADHAHTLNFAGYAARGNPILGLARGPAGPDGSPGPLQRDLLGRPYTTLSYANGPGFQAASDAQPEGPKRHPHFPRSASPAGRRADLSSVDTQAPDYLQEAMVPLVAETHSGQDVPVYAGGPGARLIHGVREQSYLYHAMVWALGWIEED